jgi:hypothetical protein
MLLLSQSGGSKGMYQVPYFILRQQKVGTRIRTLASLNSPFTLYHREQCTKETEMRDAGSSGMWRWRLQLGAHQKSSQNSWLQFAGTLSGISWLSVTRTRVAGDALHTYRHTRQISFGYDVSRVLRQGSRFAGAANRTMSELLFVVTYGTTHSQVITSWHVQSVNGAHA